MQVNIPYSSVLRGSSLKENYGFRRVSEPQYFQDLFLGSPSFRQRDNEDGLAGPSGIVYPPVYEIQSSAFDRWTIENSRHTFNKRKINYTQALAVDGTRVEGDEALRNRVRTAVAGVLDRREYFLNPEQYNEIAQMDYPLRGGEISLEVADYPWQMRPVSRELAELVMRVWQVCWMRMKWMMEKRVAWNAIGPRTAPHVEILAVNATELEDQTTALEECLSFFREELAPALPPQVMSMLSITLGCSPNNRDENWPDSACRVYLDGSRFRAQDAANTFDFRGWRKGKRKTPQARQGAANPNGFWEERLIAHLACGTYPRYYEALMNHFSSVEVLADFEVLRWCVQAQGFVDYFQDAPLSNRYRCVQYAAKSLDNVCRLLAAVHKVPAGEAYLALVDAYDELAGRIELTPEPLQLAEYELLSTAYRALAQSADQEKVDRVCRRLTQLLGRQTTIQGYEGTALEFWNEKNGRNALELDPLSVRLVAGELAALEESGSLSEADFERWCQRYVILHRGDEDALCARTEQLLSRQLYFDNPDAPTPLSIAESYGLDGVAVRIVRGFIIDLRARKTGSLTEEEYRQVLDFYTDVRHNYGARLEAAALPARELLCNQFAFDGSEVTAASLLARKELPELWNELTEAEARQFAAGSAPLDGAAFEHWLDRLEYDMISPPCSQAIIDMIVARSPEESRKQFVETASVRQLRALERALVRAMLRDVEARQYIPGEDYRWWVGLQQTAVDEGEPFADQIYDMLCRVTLRDDADAKTIAQQMQHWRLLSDLVVAAAPRVVNLTAERYREWIGYYKDLSQNDTVATRPGIEAAQELLNKKISDETLDMIRDQNVHGELYWTAMQSLLDRQKGKGVGLRAQGFRLWMERMKDAAQESRPIAREIRQLLEEQYRLRTDEELVYAFDVAEACGADADLLVSLVEVEYGRSLANALPADVDGARRWLRHYKFLRRQGQDELAGTVAQRLGKRPVVDGRYMLDLAREEEVGDLQLALILAEKQNSLDGRSISEIAACDRWMGHYAVLKREGLESEADEVAQKLCEAPVLEGRYVLGLALKNGAEDLETRLIEQERTARRPYSEEEYGERLARMLEGTGHTLDYVALLTDPNKSEDGEAFDRFIRCLSRQREDMGPESLNAVTEIFRKLAASAAGIRSDTVCSVREMAVKPFMQSILRADQAGLKRIVQESLKGSCTLEQMEVVYPLLEQRMPEMDTLAAGELVFEAFTGGNASSFKRYCPKMDSDMEKAIDRAGVAYLAAFDVVGERLSSAISMLESAGVSKSVGMGLIVAALGKVKGQVPIMALNRYAFGADDVSRRVLLSALADWVGTVENALPDTLNALAENMLQVRLTPDETLSGELFDGVRRYIDHGNSFAQLTERTYDQFATLWQGREDFDAVALPLLDGVDQLARTMRRELSRRMANGPVEIDERFRRVADCRDEMERAAFARLIQGASDLDDLVKRAEGEQWVSARSVARAAASADGQSRVKDLVGADMEARVEARRFAGDKLAVLSALCEVVARSQAPEYAAFADVLKAPVDQLIQDRSDTAFQECCQAFDGQSNDSCEGFARLKRLLERINADDSRALSAGTAAWCGEFAAAALARDGMNRSQVEALLKKIHRDGRNLRNLQAFCGRVYQSSIVRNDILCDVDVLLLLCVAKARGFEDLWTRYLALAMKIEEEGSIWNQGRDTDISAIVIFTYDKVAGYSDEVISQASLADYCATDARFSELQKKQKNAALKAIFQKSPHYKESKGGLFALFKH